MTTSMAIRKKELSFEREKLAIDVVKSAGVGSRDILLALLANPVFTLIAANVAIEALQRVKIKTGTMIRDIRGNTVYEYPETRPLLSQAHATLLETIINTDIALTALGNALNNSGGFAGLAKLIK